MENKKKPKTTIKEVRRKMKKLTIAEKKQIKQTETKEKERKEANKQKITQRVRVNVNIPNSLTQPQSGNFPNSFNNREQTTLLKLISDQFKQKNEPVTTSTQTFNIPPPPSGGAKSPEIKRIDEAQDDEDFTRSMEDERIKLEKKMIPIVNKPPDTSNLNILQQLRKKVEEKPQKTEEDMKRIEENLKEEQQKKLKQTTQEIMKEEVKRRAKPKTNEDIIKIEESIKERKPEERGNSKLKDELIEKANKMEKARREAEASNIPIVDLPQDTSNLGLMEKITKSQTDKIIKQEKERIAEIEKRKKINEDDIRKNEYELMKAEDKKVKKGRKPDTEEIKQQKETEKQNKSKLITERALQIIFNNVGPQEEKDLRDAYNRGVLKDKEIKEKLKKLKYPPEQIKRIFSIEE